MFRGMLTFSIGLYAGIYLAQNYDVPKVDEPEKLLQRIKDFADRHRKSD